MRACVDIPTDLKLQLQLEEFLRVTKTKKNRKKKKSKDSVPKSIYYSLFWQDCTDTGPTIYRSYPQWICTEEERDQDSL